jgi:MoxR-like ATPase
MNRFSTPDEIFGPVSISQLKNNDNYQRNIKNYLPASNIIFLDEIWKAGPAIQNALLTVLNEKIFRNGENEVRVPVKALLSASNGLPAAGEGLEALWDRFLVRLCVGRIKDDEHFIEMVCSGDDGLRDTVSEKYKIRDDEYEAWSGEIEKITVPENIQKIILYIKNNLLHEYNVGGGVGNNENNERQIYVSDRRWKKIIRLLRSAAFLNDRSYIDISDCFLIKHCIWGRLEDIDTVSSFVDTAINKNIADAEFDIEETREELLSFHNEVIEATRSINDTRSDALNVVNSEYYEINYNTQKLYIKKSDWDSLGNDERQLSLYKKKRLGSGYLAHNQGEQFKRGMSGFSVSVGENNLDLESSFVFDRSAAVSKTDAAFTIKIDGAEYKMETKVVGDIKRVVSKAGKSRERVWDSKIKSLTELIQNAQGQYEDFIKNAANDYGENLFVPSTNIKTIIELAYSTLKDLNELLLQLMEIQSGYKGIK